MKHQLLARYPLGNPHRIWKQDNFILNIASPGPMTRRPKSDLTRQKTRRAVKTCMDAGFNMMGSLWATPELAMDIVRAAETNGANLMFQDLWRYGGMGNKNIFCETNDYVGAFEDTKNWKCIKGYYLWDEPILEEHLYETRRMLDYCEKNYPDKLPYTVANPDYHALCRWEDDAYAPYIERFLNIIDPAQMSFDYFPIGKDEYDHQLQLDNSTMWYDLEVVRKAAQKRQIPFWFAYQAQKYHFYNVHCDFRFPMARSMAYAGVLYGVKALECYTEFDGVVDPTNGGPGVFFEEQKQLNKELLNLGNTLMALECLRVIHDETLLKEHPVAKDICTDMEESELLTGKLLPRISISEHQDAYGNKYLMVLNRDYEKNAHIELSLKNPSHIYEVSKNDGEQYLQYDNELFLTMHLNAGELKLYRIQPAEEEIFTIEYYLEKD